MASWSDLGKPKVKEKVEVAEEAAEPSPPLFKPIDEIKKRKKLKIAAWGPEETGKTHFLLSCPEPVYVIDTEFGASQLRKKFPDKEIYIAETFRLNPETAEVDSLASLNAVEEAVNSLKDLDGGTVGIDSGTDLWYWCEAYMKTQVSKLMREQYRFDWKFANEKWKSIIMKLLSMNTVFVITSQTKPVYAGSEDTGLLQPRWMRATPHWVDIKIAMKKIEDRKAGKTRYVGVIEKCRHERQYNKAIEDITYERLYETVKEFL